MNRAFTAWKWSLGVVARSYRTVVVLAALIALWAFAAYEWLSLPESSTLLLIFALIWAIAQLLVAVGVVGGIISGGARAVATEGWDVPLRSLWTTKGKDFLNALVFCLVTVVLVWLCDAVFVWINGHSVEVASFLTFHSQKAVSHVPIEEIYHVIEGVLWVVLSGFLLSFFMVLSREGWREAGRQRWNLLADNTFRTPFVASLLSVAVFGGVAYQLANWHPIVSPGFWDYSQVIARFSLALILISAGVLFWTLSLACLQAPTQDSSQEG
jgi:hypothetical protein